MVYQVTSTGPGEGEVEFFPATPDKALIEAATQHGMYFFVRVWPWCDHVKDMFIGKLSHDARVLRMPPGILLVCHLLLLWPCGCCSTAAKPCPPTATADGVVATNAETGATYPQFSANSFDGQQDQYSGAPAAHALISLSFLCRVPAYSLCKRLCR